MEEVWFTIYLVNGSKITIRPEHLFWIRNVPFQRLPAPKEVWLNLDNVISLRLATEEEIVTAKLHNKG